MFDSSDSSVIFEPPIGGLLQARRFDMRKPLSRASYCKFLG